jgi:hypothetical protein
MAVPGATVTDISGDGSVFLYQWTITTADHTGAAMENVQWADRSAQFQGTFGGATIILEGSNDGTNYQLLKQAAGGSDISFTSAGIAQLLEVCRYLRPRLSAVGSGASIVVSLVARRANPMRT